YIIAKDLGIDDRCVRRVIRALEAKNRIIVKGREMSVPNRMYLSIPNERPQDFL
ncbi:unnamed protein product, partial [marine sediment metagenome]